MISDSYIHLFLFLLIGEKLVIFAGNTVLVRTLQADPRIQNIYLRLPDGNSHSGTGYAVHSHSSLRNLYRGQQHFIASQGINASYTLDTLRQTIGEILLAVRPKTILTHDYSREYGQGDHPDHVTIARLVAATTPSYAPHASLLGFVGYPLSKPTSLIVVVTTL